MLQFKNKIQLLVFDANLWSCNYVILHISFLNSLNSQPTWSLMCLSHAKTWASAPCVPFNNKPWTWGRLLALALYYVFVTIKTAWDKKGTCTLQLQGWRVKQSVAHCPTLPHIDTALNTALIHSKHSKVLIIIKMGYGTIYKCKGYLSSISVVCTANQKICSLCSDVSGSLPHILSVPLNMRKLFPKIEPAQSPYNRTLCQPSPPSYNTDMLLKAF